MQRTPSTIEEQLIVKAIKEECSWESLPKRLQATLNSKEEWHRRIIEHCIKKRLQWSTCFTRKVCKEGEYYEDMMRYLRKNLALFPYQLAEYICRVMRVSTFRYYCDMIFEVMKNEQPYDSIPNFSAADALHLTGVGRNEFIDIMNKCRSKICDMVAVARIINATLVIPELDKRSFWQDTSQFSDVFDQDHCINSLAHDVKVIKKIPRELSTATRAVKHFRSWSGIYYYQDEITSLWEDYKVIRAAKSDSQLANNNLPSDIHQLRCHACYEALHFAPRIRAMGKLLVDRMRTNGPYIALHLWYEKDMLAFSGCTHDLSPDEADELRTIGRNWHQLRSLNLSLIIQLKCFYIVSVERDIFIPSYSGNMARAVEGHRRFLGHWKTISPDRQGSPRKREGPISGTSGMDRFRSEEAFLVARSIYIIY